MKKNHWSFQIPHFLYGCRNIVCTSKESELHGFFFLLKANIQSMLFFKFNIRQNTLFSNLVIFYARVHSPATFFHCFSLDFN